jgi:hypothetical protein
MDRPSSDHPHFDAEDGPWPMGWAIALGAGGLAALCASGIAGASGAAGFVIGLMTFAVFGALLGAGGVERTAAAGDDHGHPHGGGHH